MQIFKAIPLVKNLPLNIECLTAHDDCLIIATKQGHLMRYKFATKKNVQISTSLANQELEVELVKSVKNISKKTISQLETIPELRIIVSLSDGLIHIDSLDDLSSIQILQKTKGASCFATNLKSQLTLTGEFQYVLRLCVVVKRRIVLLYWKNKNFHEMSKEITLKDTPKTIAWASESLCVGYKSDYQLIKLNLISLQNDENDVKNLPISCGKQADALIKVINNDKFAVNKDENTYIVDEKGDLYFKQPICWSDIPKSMYEDDPYLIALLSSSLVEIRTIKPHIFIQRLELAQLTSNYSKVKILTSCARRKGLLIAASSNDIFAIVSIPIEQQKSQMMSEKHFELALLLAKSIEAQKETTDQSDEEAEGIRNIELQYAHDLFNRDKYKEALDLFLKLDLSPLIVIDLYPELSDKAFTQQQPQSNQVQQKQQQQTSTSSATSPTMSSTISGKINNKSSNVTNDENEKIAALIDYLIQIRRKISSAKSAFTNSTKAKQGRGMNLPLENSYGDFNYQSQLMQEPNLTFKSHLSSTRSLERLKQEVDTTLLKCYLKTTSALVAPLLRLPDNNCKLQVTEKALLKYNKYNELIILYKSRSLHRKSLELLKSQFLEDSAAAIEKTVTYLQSLGLEYMEIICEYAKWVLDEKPELGLKIFIADQPETEQLDRNLVLEFLHHNAPQLVISYLEHIIYTWNDKTPLFHNTLLTRYRQKVAGLLAKYVDSLDDGTNPCAAGKEPGELGEMRRKLLDFLQLSDSYSVEGLSTLLLNEGLCEERAIVVGKLGQHEEALSIFIYVLDNPKRAEEYCESVYKKKGPNSEHIFLLLLKLYLKPPDSLIKSRRVSLTSATQSDRRVSVSSRVMPWIDTSKVDFSARIIKLLNDHSDKIDPIAVLNELPDEFNLSTISDYLSLVFKRNTQQCHEMEMFRQLVMSKFYRVQKNWIKLQQSNRVVIEDTTICQVCMKKIGKSAFVRFPNFDLVHYSCKDLYGKIIKTVNPGSFIGSR